jgi:formiminoglutamase
MTKSTITQSQKRFEESVGKLFEHSDSNLQTCLFLTSSSDTGVIRNGGRNGARFAPQAFLSTFKKFSQVEKLKKYQFTTLETSSSDEEQNDFHAAQINQSIRIENGLRSHSKSTIIHLGGGHDHIYPLLRALSSIYKKFIVINIDAHADTRTDSDFHSGTPFRQFGVEFPDRLKLFQIGLNTFANSYSTLTPIAGTKMKILWATQFQLEDLEIFFSEIENEIDPSTCVILSLDTDAINGSIVPGVSAVNPSGLNLIQLTDILKKYKQLRLNHQPILGIYELNPLYDSVAGISMRLISNFVFEFL